LVSRHPQLFAHCRIVCHIENRLHSVVLYDVGEIANGYDFIGRIARSEPLRWFLECQRVVPAQRSTDLPKPPLVGIV
jgi:hypothetical protein